MCVGFGSAAKKTAPKRKKCKPIGMPKPNKKKPVVVVVEPEQSQAATHPRVDDTKFAFNQRSAKKIKLRFVLEAEAEILDI